MSVVPPLPRPEYVSAPEVYHSALAWSLVPDVLRKNLLKPAGMSSTAKVVGVVYKDETPAEKEPRNVALVRTYPDKEWEPWGKALEQNGLVSASPRLGEAVADAMLGVAPENSLSRIAVPLTVHSALLQNPHGALRKAGPPPVAQILEVIFAMGGGGEEGAAARWKQAMEVRQTQSPVLQAIDNSVKATLILPLFDPAVVSSQDVLTEGATLGEVRRAQALNWSHVLGERTPFGWFREAWELLTSPEWASRLPPRVWVDWVTTVIRTGVATAYLWEAAWYERLAMTALDTHAGEEPSYSQLVEGTDELIPWRRSTESVGIRDVVSPLKRRVHRGAAVRAYIESAMQVVADNAEAGLTLQEFFREAARPQHRQGLKDALRSTKKTLVWEAVRYGLSARSTGGEGGVDFYGLVHNRGTRYAVVAPGTEWTALMVALACGEPSGESTVAVLRRQLRRLGLMPELAELVGLLETAGLARGNADADEAVLIRSPF